MKPITDTEKQILVHLLDGKTTKRIAKEMHASPRTLESRIDRLRAKFDAKNRVQLISKIKDFFDCSDWHTRHDDSNNYHAH